MARKDISMTEAEVQSFLHSARTLQVATLGRTGHPHLSSLWFVMEGPAVVFRSFTKSQKIVNLRRDPRLTVLAERGEAYEELQGVMIRGRGRLIDDPEYVLGIYGKLAARYPMVGGAPVQLDGAAVEAAFGRFAAKNTAVVVEPEHIASWDHPKLAGAY